MERDPSINLLMGSSQTKDMISADRSALGLEEISEIPQFEGIQDYIQISQSGYPIESAIDHNYSKYRKMELIGGGGLSGISFALLNDSRAMPD